MRTESTHLKFSSQLRYFGGAVVAASWILALTLARAGLPSWLAVAVAAAGTLVGIVYYAWPSCQRRVVAGFQAATFPVRWLATGLALALVYYAVITPIAIWFRFRGKSILRRDAETSDRTAWQSAEWPADDESYFRMF
jgi:hypothetical protein